MNTILYIGEEDEYMASLKASGVSFDHVKNVVGFHNKLESIDQYQLVISEMHLKGLKADKIYERYKGLLNQKRIPFSILDSNLDLGKRLKLMKLGIMELYPPELDAKIIEERIPFLRQMLEAKLGEKRKTNIIDYKIPLAKRVFDVTVAGLALIMLLPILIIVIIALKLESRGPIYYVSKRVGTGYKVFDFYKFRSMYVDADSRLKDMKHLNQYANQDGDDDSTETKLKKEYESLAESPTLIYKDGTPMSEEEYLELKKKQAAGTFIKIKDDPRVTKVGAFIRNASIDELPQLINVLKGDMSIVGNRPLPLYEAEQLTSDDWGERFLAPAGITGLWQVEKRGKGEMSEEERKALDNKYAKNFSFWNDIRLILKTIPALFQKENV